MTELSVAQRCAALSALVYGRPGLSDVAPLGFRWCMPYARGASQALLAGDGGAVYAAFRGTDEPMDVLTDVRYVKAPFPGGGRVHKGFRAAFLAIWPTMREALDSIEPGLPRIYTGHSMGGALAMLAAVERPPALVHVFGCPRVGNAAFVRSLAGVDITRHEARRDPVTWAPPPTSPVQVLYSLVNRRWPTLYRHAGRRAAVDSAGHFMSGYERAMFSG
jgi:pimeloyl-ACP methyl ester carboxylesterase